MSFAPSVSAAELDWAECERAGIELESAPTAAWRDAVLELCREFPSLPDRDPGAAVQLSAVQEELLLSVRLHDGRTAQRRLHAPDALRSAVEALVVIPPVPASTGTAVTPYHIEPPPSLQSSSEPRTLQLEISGGLAGRSSHSRSYLSLGASAGVGARWGKWLFGLNLRLEPWTRVSAGYLPGFEMSTSGVGFLVGRRVASSSSVSLDGGVTSTLLSEAQSVQLSEREVSGTDSDVRVGLLARGLFGHDPLRLSVSLDAEVSPARAGRRIQAADELAPLPSFSFALGLGLTWLEP